MAVQYAQCTQSDVYSLLNQIEKLQSIMQLLPFNELNKHAKKALDECSNDIRACVQKIPNANKNVGLNSSSTPESVRINHNRFHAPSSAATEEKHENTTRPRNWP